MNEQSEQRPRRYAVTLTFPTGAQSLVRVWAYDAKDAVYQATLGLMPISHIEVVPAPKD